MKGNVKLGLAANQAKFLAITSRKVDLEYRMQQITNRRVRLANEMESIADNYNKAISDRRLYLSKGNNYEELSVENLLNAGYGVYDSTTGTVLNGAQGLMINSVPQAQTTPDFSINSEEDFLTLVEDINSGTSYSNVVLNCDIDLSDYLGDFGQSIFDNTFTGEFDGQGHTISGVNLKIGKSESKAGVFSELSAGAKVSNLILSDITVDASGSMAVASSKVGILAGVNDGEVDNVVVVDSRLNLDAYVSEAGIIAGRNSGEIKNSVAQDFTINGDGNNSEVGGIAGNNDDGLIETSYSKGEIDLGSNSTSVGGIFGAGDTITGTVGSPSILGENSYSNTNISVGENSSNVGGAIGTIGATGTIENSYSSGTVVTGSGSTDIGGFSGDSSLNTDTNFWNIETSNQGTSMGSSVGLTSTQIAAGNYPIETWDQNIWDTSGNTPQLIGTNIQTEIDLQSGLRDGTYSVVRKANQFTQDPILSGGQEYELLDWRSLPIISDDLYEANDYTAQTQYEAAVNRINTKDKKLEMEQQKIETEYNAITTEKDTIKKIISKNAEKSFKIFG